MVINKNEDINNLPAAYQLYPKGKQQCSNCYAYQPSGNCTVWNGCGVVNVITVLLLEKLKHISLPVQKMVRLKRLKNNEIRSIKI